MSTENTGVQTRAMAQRSEGEPHESPNQDANPTVELHKAKDDSIVDTMSLEEAEHKIYQFCQLWQLYADISVELRRKLELSQESAVTACRVYVPYISDIVRQLDEVMKIFAIEKELRTIKNRGYFPVPQITPQDNKIKTGAYWTRWVVDLFTANGTSCHVVNSPQAFFATADTNISPGQNCHW